MGDTRGVERETGHIPTDRLGLSEQTLVARRLGMGRTKRHEPKPRNEDPRGNPERDLDPPENAFWASFRCEDEWGDEHEEEAFVVARSPTYAMLEVIRHFPDALRIRVRPKPRTFLEWWGDVRIGVDDEDDSRYGLFRWRFIGADATLAILVHPE